MDAFVPYMFSHLRNDQVWRECRISVPHCARCGQQTSRELRLLVADMVEREGRERQQVLEASLLQCGPTGS
jgi:Zn ribbon nucleic-acid-binding protein